MNEHGACVDLGDSLGPSDVGFYSQFGEDKVLARLFAGVRRGICVEVGANNGVDGSTTLHFEEAGWDCILIEPNPILCDQIRKRRRAVLFECAASSQTGAARLNVAQGFYLAHAVSAIGGDDKAADIRKAHGHASQPITVQTRTLDDIFAESKLDRDIDFISIDVEGHEMDALRGLDLERWKPKILIIENNEAALGAAVRDHLSARDYRLVYKTGVNDWYACASAGEITARFTPTMLYASRFRSMFQVALARIAQKSPGLVAAYRKLRGHGA